MVLIESFSGVRGLYPRDINTDVATRYAQAFLNVIGPSSKIVIGRDTRPSGQGLSRACLDACRKGIDVGILPTPAIEHAVRAFKADGGIIVTASHNPPDYNGFKFLGKTGAVLEPAMMERVIAQFHELQQLPPETFLETYIYTDVKRRAETRNKEALAHYAQFLDSFLTSEDKKRIRNAHLSLLLDPNGGAGVIASGLLQAYGITTSTVHAKMGEFKHDIEPSEQALKGLVKDLKSSKAQFAAAFDCDADRVEVMLPSGSFVSGNQLFALLVQDLLSGRKHREQEIVVANDATSYLVKETVEEHEGRWVEVEVGETNVVRVMEELQAPLGGEGSNGGVIVAPSKCRDGILTILLLCRLLARREKTLKELVSELPEYAYLKEKLAGSVDRDRIKAFYLKKGFTIEQTGDETGGLKAISPKGWVWFRQSKTESNVTRVIADSKDKLEAKKLLREALTCSVNFLR